MSRPAHAYLTPAEWRQRLLDDLEDGDFDAAVNEMLDGIAAAPNY